MKDDSRNYILVGAFVVAMIAGLFLWLALLSGRTGSTNPYYIEYEDVTGLKTGTEIFFNGYPIGYIEAIGPAPDGAEKRFRVDVSVQEGWRIPADSVARITASSLLAGFVVNVSGGRSDAALAPGDRIPSQEATNLMAVVAETAEGMSAFLTETLKPQIEDIVSDAKQTMDQVNLLLSSENTGRIASILRNLEEVSEEVNAMTAGLGDTRRRMDAVLVKLDTMIEENQGELSHSIADLHESLEAMSRHADAIAHNLEVTTRNMNEFSQQIRENPGVILRGRSPGDDEGGQN